MKILYLSCHSILEHDEIRLFTELGHEVFSFGAYLNPLSPHDKKRPPVPGKYDDYLVSLASQCSQENLLPELIAPFDVIIVMHRPDWIARNWPKFKGKIVVLRTIGQSDSVTEISLMLYRPQGLKIVRYSPAEQEIPRYLGADAIIRFYKDEHEFCKWNGRLPAVVTVAQSMKQREKACGYALFDEVTQNFPRKLFGAPSRNPDGSLMEDPLWSGELTYDELKAAYRDNRAYFYTGTYPASYTLNFIEAFMTGIPVVAIGPKLADLSLTGFNGYEVHQLIQHGINGFCSDDLQELRSNVEYLLAHPEEGKKIGERGRTTAIQLFGKEKIKNDWKNFFDAL